MPAITVVRLPRQSSPDRTVHHRRGYCDFHGSHSVAAHSCSSSAVPPSPARSRRVSSGAGQPPPTSTRGDISSRTWSTSLFLMQENRAFDHYFDTLQGVRGFGDPHPPSPLPSGKPVWAPAGRTRCHPFHPTRPISASPTSTSTAATTATTATSFLRITNLGGVAGRVTVTNVYDGGSVTHVLRPGQSFRERWSLESSFGWYDLSVEVDTDENLPAPSRRPRRERARQRERSGPRRPAAGLATLGAASQSWANSGSAYRRAWSGPVGPSTAGPRRPLHLSASPRRVLRQYARRAISASGGCTPPAAT